MKASIGKYIPGDTLIHKMNPLIKILINIIFIVIIFIADSLFFLIFLFLLAILIFLISQLRKKQLFSIFITTLVIGIFLFTINLFLIKEGYAPAENNARVNYHSEGTMGNGYFFNTINVWKIKLTDKSIFQTLFIMIRIYIMIILTTCLTATTKPTALTRGIEQLIYPLKIFFVPVHIIAMIISIALRFIPTLLEEAQRIMKAQASRGVDFKNGNLATKAKSMVTLIIPLFVSAFEKAEDLGNAMETRGYDPYEKRTRYRKYYIRKRDVLVCLVTIGIIVFVAFSKQSMIPFPQWWI